MLGRPALPRYWPLHHGLRRLSYASRPVKLQVASQIRYDSQLPVLDLHQSHTMAQTEGAKAPTIPQPPNTSTSESQGNTKKGKKAKYVPPRLAAKAKLQAVAKSAGGATGTLTAAQSREAEPRAVPSAESGGIPEPRPEYLSKSLQEPTKLSAPRRVLVVMDLNGTLLHRPTRRRPKHFVERPHASNFLQYCLDTFYLAIWSSARPENVQDMVSRLLTPEQRDRCIIIWARDQLGLSPEDYDRRVQCYKRLDRIWNHPDILASHPEGGRWDQSDTVLVDDSSEKGRSEPFNILALPEFSAASDESAQVLPQVHDYLNSLCWQADVSSYMRRNPFHVDQGYSLPE